MKQGKLVRTRNVVEADEAINLLVTRPKEEMVGLGLLYGKPGLGKTTYATRIALQLQLCVSETGGNLNTKVVHPSTHHWHLQLPQSGVSTFVWYHQCHLPEMHG